MGSKVVERMEPMIRQRVDLTESEIEAVSLCAVDEIRGAREQLRVLIRDALIARGYLSEEREMAINERAA